MPPPRRRSQWTLEPDYQKAFDFLTKRAGLKGALRPGTQAFEGALQGLVKDVHLLRLDTYGLLNVLARLQHSKGEGLVPRAYLEQRDSKGKQQQEKSSWQATFFRQIVVAAGTDGQDPCPQWLRAAQAKYR